MTASWTEIVLVGTVVGLVSFFGPLILDYVLMMRFVRYVNMDMVRFLQLLETGGAEALALPLSQKLSEKGVLLSWKTQRDLTHARDACLSMGDPLEAEVYAGLVASLETYRSTVGMLSDRIGVLAWHAGEVFEGSVPKVLADRLRSIDRDWAEFRRFSRYLQSFLRRHAGMKTERLSF